MNKIIAIVSVGITASLFSSALAQPPAPGLYGWTRNRDANGNIDLVSIDTTSGVASQRFTLAIPNGYEARDLTYDPSNGRFYGNLWIGSGAMLLAEITPIGVGTIVTNPYTGMAAPGVEGLEYSKDEGGIIVAGGDVNGAPVLYRLNHSGVVQQASVTLNIQDQDSMAANSCGGRLHIHDVNHPTNGFKINAWNSPFGATPTLTGMYNGSSDFNAADVAIDPLTNRFYVSELSRLAFYVFPNSRFVVGAGSFNYSGRQIWGIAAVPSPTPTIQGVKWADYDCDGVRDPGENGLAGWTINLSPGGQTAVTAADGSYSFSCLNPGTYTVTETRQSCWSQSFPVNAQAHTIVLTTAQPLASNIDFGNCFRCCARIFNELVICNCTTSGYTMSYSIQNLSSTPVYSLVFANVSPANVTISPLVDNLGTPMNRFATRTRSYAVSGAGAVAGANICFDVILRNQSGVEICRVPKCVTLPECTCTPVVVESIVPASAPNTYTYTFRLQNRSCGDDMHLPIAHIFLVDDPAPPTLSFSPNYFNLNGLPLPPIAACPPTNGLSGYYKTTITTGSTSCPPPAGFHFITTNADVNCSCKVDHEVCPPTWVQPGVCCFEPCSGGYARSIANIGPADCTALYNGTYYPPPSPTPFGGPWPCGLCTLRWAGVTGMSFFGSAIPEFDPDSAPVFIHVRTIGSSGHDGVCIVLDPTSDARIDIGALDETYDLAPGSSIEVLARGTVNGQPGQDLGNMIIVRHPIGADVFADFSSVGATTSSAFVYNQGVIVAYGCCIGSSGQDGVAIAQMPDRFARGRVNGAPDATLYWSTPTQITIPGGPTVTGDKLRMIANNPTGTMSALEEVCLSFNGTPDVMVLNVVAGETGDMNCDGAINLQDISPFVLALLDPPSYASQYGQCDDFKADMNHDGTADARDIQAFTVIVLLPP